jgi:hypothetical protein
MGSPLGCPWSVVRGQLQAALKAVQAPEADSGIIGKIGTVG